MDLKLRGKTALITGGSRGIGRAIAETLAEEGVSLRVAARTLSNLQELQQSLLQKYSIGVEIFETDLSRVGAAAELANACDGIDILVNNAGAVPAGSLHGIEEDVWRKAWDLKVFGYINLTRACYLGMRERGHGVVLNVIGTAGERHDPSYIAGTTGNASLMAFTRALGSRSHRDNIRVLGINPGLTRTDRLEKQARTRARMAGKEPADWQQMLGQLPFNRPAEAREVADVAAFMVSPRASYVSGTIVTVDAGHSVVG